MAFPPLGNHVADCMMLLTSGKSVMLPPPCRQRQQHPRLMPKDRPPAASPHTAPTPHLPDLPPGAVPGVNTLTGELMMKLPNGMALPWKPTNPVSTAPVLKRSDGETIWVRDLTKQELGVRG
jgi:hypothetical protein